MIRILKTLLLWLVIAALPIQGYAAAMKMSCGPLRHDMALAAGMATPHHPAHDAAHPHHHDSGAMHAHDDAAAKADNTGHKHDSCSVCAACSVSAAAPPFAMDWRLVFNGAETVLVAPAMLDTGFIPEGVERPPRKLSS